MLRVLSLLLPALIPSWRFFQTVEPSPRVQWALAGGPWRAYRPRPATVGPWEMLRRLVWNPDWNEALFMVSLAERLTLDPDAATLAEIWARVAHEAMQAAVRPDQEIRFRLVFVSRESDAVTFASDPRSLSTITHDV